MLENYLVVTLRNLYKNKVFTLINIMGLGVALSVMLLDSIRDYFVAINAGILLIAVTIMVVATFITLIVKIASAAIKNPVDSLRYE